MDNRPGQDLWILSQAGPFRFCGKDQWQSIFSRVVAQGWHPPSEDETGWLVSPLSDHMPGSFFTAGDAKSFADKLSGHMRRGDPVASDAPDILLENVVHLFRLGAVFISEAPLENTLGTDSVEVVHVYLCPECGFMHHGKWLYSIQEADTDEIASSVESMLEHIYCPLCSCTRILSEAFILPQLDPTVLSSCLQDPISSPMD
jgi:hypothetical protein